MTLSNGKLKLHFFIDSFYLFIYFLKSISFQKPVRCHTVTLTYTQSSLIQSSPGDSDTIHPGDDRWHCWHTYMHHCTAYQSDQLDTLQITDNF